MDAIQASGAGGPVEEIRRVDVQLGHQPQRFRDRLVSIINPAGTLRFDLFLFFSAFLGYFLASDTYLNDYDAVNYALAVREFNVALDMPHPPGAPLFVFLARFVHYFVDDIPLSLALASACGGAAFVILWRRIFDLFLSPRAAAVGAIVLAISPGVWMTSSQLMSDSVAAAALSSCLLLALYYARGARPGVFMLFSAMLALSVGIRPQYGLLAIFLFFSSMLYFRLAIKDCVRAVAVFTVVNLAWLLPTIYSQYNLDGTGWMTYFNQIIRFKTHFDSASGSPLLADGIDVLQTAKRGGVHVGSLGYFGLGLNLWYPDSVGAALAKLGTELNPWYEDTAEWTYAGSFYTLVYVICCAVLLTRTKHYQQRIKRSSRYLGYLLLFAMAYFLIVVMVVPPHIRFYLPIMPFFVLLALLGAQSTVFNNKLQYALLVAALASSLPTLSESLNSQSPPLALIEKVRSVSNETGEGTVLILNANASRHAMWYLPEAELIIREHLTRELEPAEVFVAGKRVFSNTRFALPDDAASVQRLGRYRRSFKVWMRHTSNDLYELTPTPEVRALSPE
ncbi:MAG: protein O-mannosyl-transferase family [Granulosicoccaceae bacterium]